MTGNYLNKINLGFVQHVLIDGQHFQKYKFAINIFTTNKSFFFQPHSGATFILCASTSFKPPSSIEPVIVSFLFLVFFFSAKKVINTLCILSSVYFGT